MQVPEDGSVSDTKGLQRREMIAVIEQNQSARSERSTTELSWEACRKPLLLHRQLSWGQYLFFRYPPLPDLAIDGPAPARSTHAILPVAFHVEAAR